MRAERRARSSLPLRASSPGAAEKRRDYSTTKCDLEKVLWGRGCRDAAPTRGVGLGACCWAS